MQKTKTMTKKLLITLSILPLLASCGMRGGNNAEQQTDIYAEEICEAAIFDEGAIISGIRWATRNIDTLGTFAKNSEDTGGFFTFDEAQNACPQGWRVPTQEEFQSLSDVDSKWTTKNGVIGRLFGSESNQLFLPAAGWRNVGGALQFVGDVGSYWSSTAYGTRGGWWLWVGFGGSGVSISLRAYAHSIRCVAIN